MTCIVGLVDRGTVWMGGDSAQLSGWTLDLLADGKIAHVPPYLVGASGDGRMCGLLQYRFHPPPPPADPAELGRFMSVEFADAWRTCLKDGGYNKSDNGREDASGWIIVAVSERLFTLDGSFASTESRWPYVAIGCAREIALGVLYATEDQPPKQRIQQALAAAEAFSGGVRAPFTILRLEEDEAMHSKGGKPSHGTPADRRLAENKPRPPKPVKVPKPSKP